VPEVSSSVEPACDDFNCDKSQESNADASDACAVDTSSPNIHSKDSDACAVDTSSPNMHSKDNDACADARSPGSWSVSFEQFIASILTESEVVEHLSQPLDIKVRPLWPSSNTTMYSHICTFYSTSVPEPDPDSLDPFVFWVRFGSINFFVPVRILIWFQFLGTYPDSD
jgi:hypothetical protein